MNKNNRQVKYIYPELSHHDFGWFRISGPGLANCMFIAARAYMESKKYNCKFIAPSWNKFSIGPILRREKDTRTYFKIFGSYGISGISKLLLILRKKWLKDPSIISIQGLGNFFAELNTDYDTVIEYFNKIIRPETIKNVNAENLKNTIAIHVRLGDYVPRLRIDINWYKGLMTDILKLSPNQQFAIFSDGTDEELRPILDFPNTQRVFFGNAFADMYAISKCRLLIASNSTFSAWGAFLGKVPIIFCKRHFTNVYSKEMNVPEIVLGDANSFPHNFKHLLYETIL